MLVDLKLNDAIDDHVEYFVWVIHVYDCRQLQAGRFVVRVGQAECSVGIAVADGLFELGDCLPHSPAEVDGLIFPGHARSPSSRIAVTNSSVHLTALAARTS